MEKKKLSLKELFNIARGKQSNCCSNESQTTACCSLDKEQNSCRGISKSEDECCK